MEMVKKEARCWRIELQKKGIYYNSIFIVIISSFLKKRKEIHKMEFKKTRALVKDILEKEPQTRNSDAALYLKVVERLNPTANEQSFESVLMNLEKMGLPCFETVRRTRQKVQEVYPRLKACDVVQDYRTELEMEYRKEFGSC